MTKRTETILSEAKKYHAKCQRITIYDYYKAQIELANIDKAETELAINELSKILGL